MTVRMTGAEFKRFYSDPLVWKDDTYTDDVLVLVDGANSSEADIDLSEVADTALVEIHRGEIAEGVPGVPIDMADAALWWRERQANVHFNVAVPRNQVDAFKAALAALGLKALAL